MIPGVPYDAEIEYLKSTGTQLISSVISATSTTRIKVLVSIATTVNGFAFGAYADPTYIGAQYYSGIGLRVFCGRDSTNYNQSGFVAGTPYLYDIDNATGAISVDGTVVKTTGTAGGVGSTINLFGNVGTDASSASASCRIYSVQIWDDGVLVRDMIPVRFTNELEQSEGAMYDRVTRRIFRNAGTGAFVLGPDVARPVLGLKRFASVSAADYVQTGLVAMWDGIENAGWGVHDASATAWNDLVSNITMVLGSANWGAGNWIPSAKTYGYVSDLSRLSCLGSDYTLETVYAPQKDSTVSYGPIVYSLSSDTTPVRLVMAVDKYAAGAHTLLMYQRHSANVNAEIGSINGINSQSVSHANNMQMYCLNGNYISYLRDKVSGVLTPERFWVNRGYFGYNKGRYYNIRIYSRALTAGEIAANYAIDKVRFNLP